MTGGRRLTAYLPTAAAHLVFAALVVFAVDGILLKFAHASSRLLPGTLAAILALSLLCATRARRIPAGRRDALDRVWASLDRYSLVWLVVFLMLLMLFHMAYTRAGGDGRSYFAQLHAMFIAHSLDMDREARAFGAQNPGIFPLGSAILWLPFYALAHVWLLVLNMFGGGFRRDGYLYPYQMAAGLGSLVYGFTGLVLIYRVACDYFSRWVSLAATLVVCGGSFLLFGALVIEAGPRTATHSLP